MINVDSYVSFLIKNKLTQQQFLLLYLLYTRKVDYIKDYKTAFPSDDGSMIGTYYTKDLIRRGYLEKRIKGLKTSYILTPKFPRLFENIQNLTEIVLNKYPAFADTGTSKLPLALVDVKDFYRLCLEYVGNDPNEYQEILLDIAYGKQHNLIKYKIDKFIQSKFYLRIRELRKGTVKGTTVYHNDLTDL